MQARNQRETERERRSRMLDEVLADITANGGGLRMADNLPREALYNRAEEFAAFRKKILGDRRLPGNSADLIREAREIRDEQLKDL